MSIGVKEVLIKSVAQATPTYIMGVFKLPDTTGERMTQLICKFWWGGGEKTGKGKSTGLHGTNC
jgi:hypothetical protein